jgi:hypothetical protein
MNDDKLKKANELSYEMKSLKKTVKHIETNEHHNFTVGANCAVSN